MLLIDEAAQALEASCWIQILKTNNVILAGDHCQLPPTILCNLIESELGLTLFDRAIKLHGAIIIPQAL